MEPDRRKGRQRGMPPGALPHNAVLILDAVARGAVSHDQIMAATGQTRAAVSRWVNKLCKEGILVREEGRQNTLRPAVEVVAQIHR